MTRPLRSAFALVLFLIAGMAFGAPTGAEAAPAGPLRAGVFRTQRIKVNGRTRRYRLVVPRAALSGTPVPLVLAFHGFTQDRNSLPAVSRLEQLAMQEGFVLVFPEGRGRRWDLRLTRNPDLRFFDRLYERLAGRYRIDGSRVYATGFSMGGAFVNLLAVRRAERLAAVAPHSGFLPSFGSAVLPRQRPGVLVIQGDRDWVVAPAAGRRTRDWFLQRGYPVQYLEIPGLGHAWGKEAGVDRRIWEHFGGFTLESGNLPR